MPEGSIQKLLSVDPALWRKEAEVIHTYVCVCVKNEEERTLVMKILS